MLEFLIMVKSIRFAYFEGYDEENLFLTIYKELREVHPDVSIEVTKAPPPEMGGIALPPNFCQQFIEHEITKSVTKEVLSSLASIAAKHMFSKVAKRKRGKDKLCRNIVFKYNYPTELDMMNFEFEFSPWLNTNEFQRAIEQMGDFIKNHNEDRSLESAGFWRFQYDRKDSTWYEVEEGRSIDEIETLLNNKF